MENVRVVGESNDQSHPTEVYFFARGVKSAGVPVQVQRLHKGRHTEALFDVKRKSSHSPRSSSPSGKRSARGGRSLSDASEPLKKSKYYTAYNYESSNENLVEFSAHKIKFSPCTTPRTTQNQLIPELPTGRAMATNGPFSSNRYSESSSSLSDDESPRTSRSSRSSTTVVVDANDASFFGQPVVWNIVYESETAYKVVDAATDTVVGRWKHSSVVEEEDEEPETWLFFFHGHIIARVEPGMLEVMPPSTADYVYLDVASMVLRERAHQKISRGEATMPPSIKSVGRSATFPFQLGSTSMGDRCPIRDKDESLPYRARFVDAIVFSALSLRLAVNDRAKDDTTLTDISPASSLCGSVPRQLNQQILRPVRTASNATFSRLPRTVVSSIKQVISL